MNLKFLIFVALCVITAAHHGFRGQNHQQNYHYQNREQEQRHHFFQQSQHHDEAGFPQDMYRQRQERPSFNQNENNFNRPPPSPMDEMREQEFGAEFNEEFDDEMGFDDFENFPEQSMEEGRGRKRGPINHLSSGFKNESHPMPPPENGSHPMPPPHNGSKNESHPMPHPPPENGSHPMPPPHNGSHPMPPPPPENGTHPMPPPENETQPKSRQRGPRNQTPKRDFMQQNPPMNRRQQRNQQRKMPNFNRSENYGPRNQNERARRPFGGPEMNEQFGRSEENRGQQFDMQRPRQQFQGNNDYHSQNHPFEKRDMQDDNEHGHH